MTDDREQQWWPGEIIDSAVGEQLASTALQLVRFALEQGRMPPALLVIGPLNLGREQFAVETAAALICPETTGADGDRCTCRSCQRVRRGVHPDVMAVFPTGAARRISIDRVRTVVNEAPGRPFEAACRVWIFDGVEASGFGAEAANAFLKTLEEPPEHVRFILLAANPEAVLPTIRSRCQTMMLPGGFAAARTGEVPTTVPELLGAGYDPEWMDQMAGEAEDGLRDAAESRESLDLLRRAVATTRACADLEDPSLTFGIWSAAALRLACESESGHDLVALASDLLRVQQSTVALNLAAERQLIAALFTWFNQQ